MTGRIEKVGTTLPITLEKQVGRVRGDVPRSTFIRRAIERFRKRRIKRLHPVLKEYVIPGREKIVRTRK